MIAQLYKIKEALFLLGIMTLPVYQTINHWFFGGFLGISLLILIFDRSALESLTKQWLVIIVVSALFFLKVIGIFNAVTYDYGVNESVRALPFLIYPIAILSFRWTNDSFKIFERKVFYALTIGCIITAIICWGNVLISLNANDIPANRFFGWKKSGIHLTKVLDMHPPYLGMLIVGSIIFLFKEVFFNKLISLKLKWINSILALFLFIFLFNITARNIMFFLMLLSIGFLVYKKYWKLILIPVIAFVVLNLIIINHPSKYYRIKMYEMIGLTKSDNVDRRFSRLEASFEVFKTSPIFGVGMGNDHELRVNQYEKMNDQIAANKRLNSHNQLFEYLVSFGLIGALIFIAVNLFLIRFLYRNGQYFYLILLCSVLMATLTESTFERVLGIQYFSIIAAMAALAIASNKTENKKDH
jgi:hypothetical protein